MIPKQKAKTPELISTTMRLVRPNKPQIPANLVTFETESQMTKPEIRQYLQKLYKIDNIEKVDTYIRTGKVQFVASSGKPKKVWKDGKKVAFVYLKDNVDEFFQRHK